jgi:TatD DNase family protein
MNAGLVDIGVNLVHARFKADRGAVLERAAAAGVEALIITGTSVWASRAALELARTRPGFLYSTAGVHPHDARHSGEQTLDELRSLAASREVVAIGECGLDFNRDFSPRPAQERCFEAQAALACELGLPLFLHERDAHERFVQILGGLGPLPASGVVHCFTGSAAELEAYLELGLHIGITGWICDERRGGHLRGLLRRIPLERLMLETDAPFLTPRDLRPWPRGGRNEPAFLPHVLQAAADALGMPAEAVARATTETAKRFFRLP